MQARVYSAEGTGYRKDMDQHVSGFSDNEKQLKQKLATLRRLHLEWL